MKYLPLGGSTTCRWESLECPFWRQPHGWEAVINQVVLNVTFCPEPTLLCPTLQSQLTWKLQYSHCKTKTAARNNVLKKHSNSKWGANQIIIRTTTLALRYSTANYVTPVKERSAHAHKVNPVLKDAYRSITGCLQPSNIYNLCPIPGIAPLAIRRSVAAQRERESHK